MICFIHVNENKHFAENSRFRVFSQKRSLFFENWFLIEVLIKKVLKILLYKHTYERHETLSSVWF